VQVILLVFILHRVDLIKLKAWDLGLIFAGDLLEQYSLVI